MSKINVVIPTYKRWNALEGLEYFGDVAKWVLPKSQEKEYSKVLKKSQMIVIPDEWDGSSVKKRMWIMENVPKPLVMIDDDVKSILYMEGRLVDVKENYSFKPLPKDLLMDWLEQGFDMCKQFNTVMWGVYQKPDEREYKEWLPFSLTKIVLGPFMAFTKDCDLQFDERMLSKDDYDMSLQVLQKHKKILRLNKFAYRCEHGDNEGGLVGQRTMEYEAKNCVAIMKKWGKNVIQYKLPPKKMTDLLNAKKVNVPIKGV